MGSYGWSQGTAYNFGTMKAGNKLNAQMEQVTLINGGTLSADNGITLISNYLTNSGNITSTSDITLNTANGVNNEASGNITGNRVYTTGYVNNMGVINETGAANQGTDNNTADDINTNPVRMPLRIIVEIPQLSQMVPLKVMVFGKTELSINPVISITAMLFRILFIITAAISSLSQRNSI